MNDGTVRSICTLCHCGCGIIADIEGGRLKSLRPDKEHPSNRDYLCPKAFAIEELSTAADRLTVPLKRTAADFEEITWEQAYDYAAERLSDIVSKHGPDGIMRCSGAPVSYAARDGYQRLMHAIGSANATGSSTYCMVPRVTAFMNAIGGKPEPDLDNADFIILWGSNPKATNRMGGYCAFDGIQKVLGRARKRGARVVFIDPVRCDSIEDGDKWVQIRPGTDTILGLGLLRCVIEEELYDHEFVENHTLGFEALRAHVDPYTPEETERRTGVPACDVVSLARRFSQAKKATICEGNGLDMYANTVYSVQAVAALLGITGRIDRKGGAVFLPFVPQAPINNLSPAKMKQKYKYPLFRDIPFPAVKESLLAGDDDRPRAMIVHHANPAGINANSERTVRALKSLDFLLVSDIFMTATASAADLILPDKTAFEGYGYKCYTSFDRPFVAFQRPLFKAPGRCRSSFENEYEIAKRMGLDGDFPYHDEVSWIQYALTPSGTTFEELDEKQLIFFDKPIVYEKYKAKGFNTPSGKMELFSTKQEQNGYSPLPLVIPGNPEEEKGSIRYPFKAINYRPVGFVHTKLHNLETTTKHHPGPKAWLNKENLEKYQFSIGAPIKVESADGEAVFLADINDTLDNDNILLEFGWGGEGDINRLTADRYFDPISGGTPNRVFRVKISKADSPFC